MLKHIVMWKLKDFALGKSKVENLQLMKEMLEALTPEIVELQKLEVGINQNNSKEAYDLVLYTEFADQAALERYQSHPKHLVVSDFVGQVRAERVVVDYFFNY